MNTTTSAAHYDTIVELATAAKGLVQDDHNQGRNKIQLAGIAILKKQGSDKANVVGLYNATAFCLNGLYVKDGEVHVSTMSIGGNVYPNNHDNDLRKAVEAYNLGQKENPFSSGDLERVVYF